MEVADFARLWQEKQGGSYKEGNAQSWDSRAEEFNRHEPDERIEKITQLLIAKKMLDENSTVLDLGCGPGNFARAFGRVAGTVVGLDISPRMLGFAREKTASEGMKHLRFVEMDWEEADPVAMQWEKQFSLVTAIMSPAIKSQASMDKMIQVSSAHGLICHFLQREDSVVDELKKTILGEDPREVYGNKGLFCAFNLLWLYERCPEITYMDTRRESSRTLEEALRQYTTRLEAKRTLSQCQKAQIVRYLTERAEGGLVKETVTAKIACITWKNN